MLEVGDILKVNGVNRSVAEFSAIWPYYRNSAKPSGWWIKFEGETGYRVYAVGGGLAVEL